MNKISFQNVHTMIGADATIEGPIKLNDGIIVYGTIIGDVETTGSVRIAHGAYVEGNIKGQNIRVGGKVTGDVKSKGQVILGKNSVLRGDIIYKTLLIEDGAQFEGKCDIIAMDE